MPTSEETRARFEAALAALVEKLKQDRYILAAILGGSLSHDEVWEKSDIDLLLIGDEKVPSRSYTLTEDGINIHAEMMPRSRLKQVLDSSLNSSFFHSYFSKSRLLFSVDDSIAGFYEDIQRVGARDRTWQLLSAASRVLPAQAKAEKWFHVKRDYLYSFMWTLGCVEGLARIAVIERGEITGREVIQQALKHDPEFFNAVYTDLIAGPKDEAAIGEALKRIDQFLEARISQVFGPILEFLSKAGGPRSTTELDTYFRPRLQSEGGIGFAYEWLADKGVIEKVPLPLRLTEKSRVTVSEAAYYYDGEDTYGA